MALHCKRRMFRGHRRDSADHPAVVSLGPLLLVFESDGEGTPLADGDNGGAVVLPWAVAKRENAVTLSARGATGAPTTEQRSPRSGRTWSRV